MVSGWSGNYGMTPILSLEAIDNIGVSRIQVVLKANNVAVNSTSASLHSTGPLKTGTCPNSYQCGIWRVQMNFSGSDFRGNWQIFATAWDSSNNQSTEVLLREIPLSN